MPYGYYYWDPTYFLVLIGVVLCLIASAKVKSTFARYEKNLARSGYTAEQVAAMILRNAGITNVAIRHTSGHLTDNFNPGKMTLNLSDSVYGKSSIAAIGVAAHECGHAIQHQQHYAPLVLRHAIIPVANIGSTLSWPLILIGILIPKVDYLITIGIIMFTVVVALQFITLPVEFNASRRALAILSSSGILYDDEMKGARKVLSAAAMTYVAAMISAVLQLLRLVMLFGGRSRD
ncbi:MAG: zinc metallopeptidase [Coprococcus sp.]|nr:zinc metallopeptidase [Coprococcus sp.]